MKCPFCGELKDRVVDSRESRDGLAVRRRRECLTCNRRFTSYEEIEDIPYMVVKNDGSREDFDRKKLLGGLQRACQKRPIPVTELQAILEAVEQKLHEQEDREISTRTIGMSWLSLLIPSYWVEPIMRPNAAPIESRFCRP